jgi:hypothetical protein
MKKYFKISLKYLWKWFFKPILNILFFILLFGATLSGVILMKIIFRKELGTKYVQ